MKKLIPGSRPKDEVVYLNDIPSGKLILAKKEDQEGVIIYRKYEHDTGYILTTGATSYQGFSGYFKTKTELIKYGIDNGWEFFILD